MPCYDERNEPSYVRAEAEREWRHNSPVAEMLCSVLKALHRHGSVAHGLELRDEPARILRENPALAQWWEQHQERDAQEARNGQAKQRQEESKGVLRAPRVGPPTGVRKGGKARK